MKPRRLFVIFLALVVLGGFIYFALTSPSIWGNARCEEVELELKAVDGGTPAFFTVERLRAELRRQGIVLEGKRMDSINLRQIEQRLLSLPILAQVNAVSSPITHSVKIEVTERRPLFVVQEPSGFSYYVCSDKRLAALSPHYLAYVPIVTGAADRKRALSDVFDLMQTLQRDSQLQGSFTQLIVDKEEGLVLIPRIGTTRLLLSSDAPWQEQLEKWKLFAAQVLPKRGINAFDYVRLDVGRQIVAHARYPMEGVEDADETAKTATTSASSPTAATPKPTATPVAKATAPAVKKATTPPAKSPAPAAKKATAAPAKKPVPSSAKPQASPADKKKSLPVSPKPNEKKKTTANSPTKANPKDKKK